MDIVSTSTKKEMKKLFYYLETIEGCENIFLIEPDNHQHSFQVDLINQRNKGFCIVGLHVHAEQVYHGVKSFRNVDEFIGCRKNMALN